MNAPERIVERQRLLAEIKATIDELEEAEKLIGELKPRSVYIGLAGGLMIEVDNETALEYVRRRKENLSILYEKLKSEEG
ncbi:MAG: hypothetical protein GSR73_03395 [Desulfurococcales archaeon]|nr:hypothetical protein [Desulfurococcales archaeon]